MSSLVILYYIYIFLLAVNSRLERNDKLDTAVRVMDRFQHRKERLVDRCGHYTHSLGSHWRALNGETPVNPDTNSFFNINSRDFAICNVLKGGSLSWKEFFLYYKIRPLYLEQCQGTQSCPSGEHRRLVQVRHPFDRLLSTWRHIFQGGGWRLLETSVVKNPSLAQQFESVYENMSWPVFVRDMVLSVKDTVPAAGDLDAPGSWIRHHWAPYWITCDICGETSPDYILKIETLLEDITVILEHEFGLVGEDVIFPKVKTLGTKNSVGEKNPKNLAETYYSQLSKEEVLALYRMYSLDFDMFDYSPSLHMQYAY